MYDLFLKASYAYKNNLFLCIVAFIENYNKFQYRICYLYLNYSEDMMMTLSPVEPMATSGHCLSVAQWIIMSHIF